MNYPLEHIRFLLENAGAMLDIHRKAILRALGLNPDSTPDSLRVDPKNTHGIRRNRFYFRNYQDGVKVSKTVVLEPSDIEGPLIDFNLGKSFRPVSVGSYPAGRKQENA